jgi:hypothetical protein
MKGLNTNWRLVKRPVKAKTDQVPREKTQHTVDASVHVDSPDANNNRMMLISY